MVESPGRADPGEVAGASPPAPGKPLIALAQAAIGITELNQHFGRRSPLTAIRNAVSFHYTDDQNLVEENFQRATRHGAVGLLSFADGWELVLLRV